MKISLYLHKIHLMTNTLFLNTVFSFSNKLERKIFLRPFCFLLFLIFCKISITSAQNFSCQNANKAFDNLTEIMDSTKQLDLMISNNIYGNFIAADIKKYENRLNVAQEILNKLNGVDKIFTDCAKDNPNDQSYLLYSSISNLTALGIVSQKNSYINYLKINKQSQNKYDELNEQWEAKEKDLLKTAKSQTNKILLVDKNNRYAQILLAVCNFYDKKQDKAIKDLLSISTSIKAEIANTKEITNETTDKEKLLSFTLTWLGYIYNDKMMFAIADTTFEEAKNIDEPDNGSIEWTDHYNKQMKDAKQKTNDLKIPEFNLPQSNGSFGWKTLKYQKENPLKHSFSDEFLIVEQPSPIISDQQELIKQTKEVWTKLCEIENIPWQYLIDQMQKCGGKFRKADYEKIFLKMNADNKGGGTNNLLLYRTRFDAAYSVLNQLLFLRQCWTNLINNNPDIAYFRLYRIKTDLGIYYINQNAKTFTDFFDYYKIKKKKIPSDYLTKIKDDFETNPMNEINDDIKYCTKDNADNITYLLTEVEIAVFTPGNALLALKEIEQKIPLKTTIGNVDPASIIELYRSYLYFKMREINELKQSAQVLNSYSNMAYWSKQLKNYIYYFENENLITK